MTLKLPASVKVGYRIYKIERFETRAAIAADRYGECSHAENVIRVALDYGPAKAAETLLHEIMHAAYAFGRLHDDDREERIVGTLANVISAIWVDNLEVMAWIGKHLNGG